MSEWVSLYLAQCDSDGPGSILGPRHGGAHQSADRRVGVLALHQPTSHQVLAQASVRPYPYTGVYILGNLFVGRGGGVQTSTNVSWGKIHICPI
jgi:hypothetical protein